MKKQHLAALLCLVLAGGSTPFSARADEKPNDTRPAAHRELPAVRKMLDATQLDLQNADSLQSYIKVFDALSKVIALDPKSRVAFAARGEVVRRALRLQGSPLGEDETPRKEIVDFDGALRDFDKAAALDSSKDDLMALIAFGRGRIYLDHKKDAKSALAQFNQSIAAEKNFGPAYLGRALAAGRGAKPDPKAIFNDYDQALKLEFAVKGLGFDEDITYKNYFQNQSLSTAYHGRGLLFALRGENDKALQDLNAAIASSLLNTAAIYDRANLHSQMNAPQKAIEDFSTLLAWRPDDVEIYHLRAAQYEKLGDNEKALADLERAKAILAGKGSTPFATETSAQAQKRGDDLIAAGKAQNAIEAYSRALEIDPKNRAALSSRGWALAWTKEYSRAASDFDAALKLRPDDAELLIARGQMYGRAGKTENALADLKRATELAPGNIAAWEHLGVVYQANGKYAEAETSFEKAVEVLIADANAPGQETTLAPLRLAIVRAAQNKEDNLDEVVDRAGARQLAGAIGIVDFELKKQPQNLALQKLRDKMQLELQILQ